MYENISEWIESEMAGYTLGTNLFHLHTPPKVQPRSMTILFRAGGEFEPDIPDRTIIYMQLLNRAEDDPTAQADALLFYEQYKRRLQVDLPVVNVGEDWFIETMFAQQSPQAIGQDPMRRFQWSTNYILKIMTRV